MNEQRSGTLERPDRTSPTVQSTHLVVAAGAGLILAMLIFRGWALFRSFFYLDDYNLLISAHGARLDGAYLAEPYNSHLMPGGRLIAWLVEHSGQLNWSLAATFTLVGQLLAGAAALWMLVTLFGARWPILAPLALYLTSAMTIPAMMWWTASLNQVPLQSTFFFSVGAWVCYLRGRRLRWLAVTVLALCLGLFFYVKALLVFPVLAFIALAYFASGGPWARFRTVVRRYWPAVLVGALAAGGYVGYYLSHVTAPFTETTPRLVAILADSMIGEAFMTAVVGGPWDWDPRAAPNAFADPPQWGVHLAWVAVVLVVLYAFFRRRGTLRAWALLGIYLAGLLTLLVNSRAPVYGRIIGLEYRYLTDAACAVALCTGLAFLSVRGAEQPSRPRDEPLLRVRMPGVGVIAVVALVCVSSVVSSVRYVDFWHTRNASDDYLHTLADDLRRQGAVDLVDRGVPDAVVPALYAPDNLVHRFMVILDNHAQFPDASSHLGIVGEGGTIREALIEDAAVLSEKGPRAGCGWLVRERGKEIPLTARAFTWQWWARIGYLASADSSVVVSAGNSRIETEILAGPNSLWIHLDGSFDQIGISGLGTGVSMCVDTIEVGQPNAAGERLK